MKPFHAKYEEFWKNNLTFYIFASDFLRETDGKFAADS
jgi:hypothetical protein